MNLLSATHSLMSKTLENQCSQLKSHSSLSHFPPICHGFLTFKQTTKELKPHAHTPHVVITVIIVITAMLTLCHSIMSHATLNLFFHVSMLTLHNSLPSYVF